MKTNRKKQLLKQIRLTPVIEVACTKTGIARATFYRWKKSDPQFVEDVERSLSEGSQLINDMAESKLISLIKDGNLTGIIFWLKNHHRQYAPKLEITAKTHTLPLTPEQKELIRKSLVLAFASDNLENKDPNGQPTNIV